jgi:hypothetical protein
VYICAYTDAHSLSQHSVCDGNKGKVNNDDDNNNNNNNNNFLLLLFLQDVKRSDGLLMMTVQITVFCSVTLCALEG